MADEAIINPHDQSIQLWEKQLGETDKAFDAFVVFRDLPGQRTYQAVADKLACSHTNVRQWASRWDWKVRADAYDRYADEQFCKQTVRDRLAHRRRQITIGQHFQSVAIAGLRELQARIEQKLPLNLDPSEIAALQKIGDDMETRGLGVDSEAGRYTQINVNLGVTADEDAVPALTPDVADGEPLQ